MITVCPYCACGCLLEVKNMQIKPVDFACIKGLSSLEPIDKDRIKKPMIRVNGELKEVSWEEAYEHIYKNLNGLNGEEILFIASGLNTNEDNYVFQRLARQVFKSNNIDSSARICHAATCYAFSKTYGIGAVINKYDDILDSDLIIIVGTDPYSDHPRFMSTILKTKAKKILINPFKNHTAKLVDHYFEVSPGTIYILFSSILSAMWEPNGTPMDTVLKSYKKEIAMRYCNLTEEEFDWLVNQVKSSKKLVITYGMGTTQHEHGINNVFSILNLVLFKKGIAFPIRGKANIQGVNDVGCNPDSLPSGDFSTVFDLEKRWNTKLPKEKGRFYVEAILINPVKAVWINDSNPLVSLPDANNVRKALEDMFVIYQGKFTNKMMEVADVVLPSCTSFEKEGTFTNAERKVQKLNRIIPPMYESKPDWLIYQEVAERFGHKFGYESEEQIFKEITEVVPAYKNIKDGYADKSKKFERYNLVPFVGLEEEKDKDYPFTLITVREPNQFCTGEMSRRSKTLNQASTGPFCIMNKLDAESLGIKDGDKVKLVSEAGELEVKMRIGDTARKVILAPFHYEEMIINTIVPLEFDFETGTPNYKNIDVRVVK